MFFSLNNLILIIATNYNLWWYLIQLVHLTTLGQHIFLK